MFTFLLCKYFISSVISTYSANSTKSARYRNCQLCKVTVATVCWATCHSRYGLPSSVRTNPHPEVVRCKARYSRNDVIHTSDGRITVHRSEPPIDNLNDMGATFMIYHKVIIKILKFQAMALIRQRSSSGNEQWRRWLLELIFRLCDNGFCILCVCGTPVVAITPAVPASPRDAKANSISQGWNNTVVVLVVTTVGTRRISDDVSRRSTS